MNFITYLCVAFLLIISNLKGSDNPEKYLPEEPPSPKSIKAYLKLQPLDEVKVEICIKKAVTVAKEEKISDEKIEMALHVHRLVIEKDVDLRYCDFEILRCGSLMFYHGY